MKPRKFALVYQAGIANVFEVDCFDLQAIGNAQRINQGTFKTAEAFCRGLAYTKNVIYSFACNKAGDITNEVWSEDLDAAPFSTSFNPVFQRN